MREELAEELPTIYHALRWLVAEALAGTDERQRLRAMVEWQYFGKKMHDELKRRGLLDELSH